MAEGGGRTFLLLQHHRLIFIVISLSLPFPVALCCFCAGQTPQEESGRHTGLELMRPSVCYLNRMVYSRLSMESVVLNPIYTTTKSVLHFNNDAPLYRSHRHPHAQIPHIPNVTPPFQVNLRTNHHPIIIIIEISIDVLKRFIQRCRLKRYTRPHVPYLQPPFTPLPLSLYIPNHSHMSSN